MVYIGFSNICGFRHPLGGLGMYPLWMCICVWVYECVLIASYAPHWCGRYSYPRVMGMAEHMTPDTRQMRLTAVISHLYSQLQGGRRHVPHKATEEVHLGRE